MIPVAEWWRYAKLIKFDCSRTFLFSDDRLREPWGDNLGLFLLEGGSRPPTHVGGDHTHFDGKWGK